MRLPFSVQNEIEVIFSELIKLQLKAIRYAQDNNTTQFNLV